MSRVGRPIEITVIAMLVVIAVSDAGAQNPNGGTALRFTVTPVAPTEYPDPYLVSFNSTGNTVGNLPSPNSGTEAILRDADGTVRRLGFLPGGNSSYAFDLSDDNWVVGQSSLSRGAHAFLWTPQSGIKDLGGDDSSTAVAINNRHQIVGHASAGARTRAMLWDPIAGMLDLGDLPNGVGKTYAQEVSDAGHVVGHAYIAEPNEPRPFLWTAERGMREIGLLPGGTRRGAASDVNDRGHVIGLTEGQSPRRAFFWAEETGTLDIGFLSGLEFTIGYAINNDDWVVGASRNPGPANAGRAFLWTPELGIADLNDRLDESARGWRIWEALRIDEQGRILSRGSRDSGAGFTVILTPIPEPAGLAPLICALLCLSGRGTHASRRSL